MMERFILAYVRVGIAKCEPSIGMCFAKHIGEISFTLWSGKLDPEE